ncbi:MAG TPA: helix-turn-helix domain-containing protein [Vicinamibacterales bacterium]|nr:helix-turn-helix domain-containing protein [Vicinamibacterales bacterium]
MAENRPLDPSARLREAREKKGLSARQVAEATKLSVRAIESLERNALSELPEGIYRRSIVRAVAREVGLNADQLLAAFTAAYPDEFPAPQTVLIAEPAAAASSSRMFAIVSAAVPMVAGLLYFGVPMVRSMLAEVPKAAVVEPRRIDPVRAEVVPVGGFVETSTPVSRPVPVVVTLTISSRCQLRVVADGTEIIGRTMEQGETVPIELGDEIILLGDNASAVQFSINGQAGRLLGEPGDVLSTRIGRDDYQDFLVRY